MKTPLFLILLLGLLPNTQCLACDFDCTLKKHLDAIQAKDFKSFEQTLTQGDRLTFILPDGKFTQDTQAYKKMLKNWFAQEGWSLDYQIIAIEKTEKMGSALLLMAYDEKNRGGKPYHLDHYLNLIFKLEQGQWRLVHDQNTKTTLSSDSSQ